MKEELSIVKIGGNIIEDEQSLLAFLKEFARLKGPKILVHGGGKQATKMSKKLGIQTQMVQGRRITDHAGIKVATMVYAGYLNKTIVAQLQKYNCNALGLSGADGNTIQANKRPVGDIDFGFVGDVKTINDEFLSRLLTTGIVPVFCALTHNGEGQMLNTNADTIASELAISLSNQFRSKLFYCFEKKGVLMNIEDDTSVITEIDKKKYQELIETSIIEDGMIPKLDNCFHALLNQVSQVHIGDASVINSNTSVFTKVIL